MKRFSLTTIIFVFLLIFVGFAASYVTVLSQSSRFREVKKSQAAKQVPPACLKVFREFFAYVKRSEPNIVTDKKAQDRWLSKHMREAFIEHIKHAGKPEENPDFPSNQTFVGVWNNPTTYSIVGSRYYVFPNSDNPNDKRAIIDVLYEWGMEETIENQYPGDKQLYSFIFISENGVWKLDDIYTYAGNESLLRSFQEYRYTDN